jgi:hypothetical protein
MGDLPDIDESTPFGRFAARVARGGTLDDSLEDFDDADGHGLDPRIEWAAMVMVYGALALVLLIAGGVAWYAL